jgi:hypothetical protein
MVPAFVIGWTTNARITSGGCEVLCPCYWVGTSTLLIICGGNGVKGGREVFVEITGVKNPSKNGRYVVPSQAGGSCHALGVRRELSNEAIIGLVGQRILLKALLAAAAEVAKLGGLC